MRSKNNQVQNQGQKREIEHERYIRKKTCNTKYIWLHISCMIFPHIGKTGT